MKMTDMGYDAPDYGSPMSESSSGKRKMKTVYPELHIRDASLKLPEGEFYVVAKVKKVGYRDPVDEGGQKECDLAILSLAPVDAEDAQKLASDAAEDVGEAKGRTPRRSLSESLKMAMDDTGEDD